MRDDENDLDVFAYANNGGDGAKPRQPLVHLIGLHYGETQSISFHPDDAPKVAEAILRAGRAAKRGRDREATVKLRQHS